jgi:hypothetical protein
MATAGTATVDTTGEFVYNVPTRGCTSIAVFVKSTSSYPALVNVPELHAAGEFFPVEIGQLMIFRLGAMGIKKAFVKGDGGSAAINYGAVAATFPSN